MAVTKKGLGRGLSALIPDDDMESLSRVARGDDLLSRQHSSSHSQKQAKTAFIAPKDTKSASQSPSNDATIEDTPNPLTTAADTLPASPDRVVEWIATGHIEANPFQPRRSFNDVEMLELVEPVRTHGILQPILVRPLPTRGLETRYQLVAGERRWRAAKEAGLELVPAVVREVADQQALELALIENVQRHDISPVGAAIAYRRLATEFDLSQDDIAKRVGKSRSAVANTLRLLDLPVEAQKAIDDGILTEGHGRAILLATSDGARRAVFRHILRDKLSVREAEHIARRSADEERKAGKSDKSGQGTVTLSVELAQTEAYLQKTLGTRVKIKPKGPKSKSGQIVIEYFSDDDLNRLLQFIKSDKSF